MVAASDAEAPQCQLIGSSPKMKKDGVKTTQRFVGEDQGLAKEDTLIGDGTLACARAPNWSARDNGIGHSFSLVVAKQVAFSGVADPVTRFTCTFGLPTF